jgi:magnesium transporter
VTEVLYGFEDSQSERAAALRSEGTFFWLDVPRSQATDELAIVLEIPEGTWAALRDVRDLNASRRFQTDGERMLFPLRCFIEYEERPRSRDRYRFQPVRVQCLVTGDYLLTVHDEHVSLPALLDVDLPDHRGNRSVVYSVLEAFLASTLYALEEVEQRLDAYFATDSDDEASHLSRRTLRATGGRLAALRRWVSAEEPTFHRIGTEIDAMPGFDESGGPEFGRLEEEIRRLVESVDAAADGTGMLLDLQLNERAYVISVIGAIFVPLTFLTGYFGMNFNWMTDHIHNAAAYWGLGVALPIVTAVVSWRLVVRRFLMDDGRRRNER